MRWESRLVGTTFKAYRCQSYYLLFILISFVSSFLRFFKALSTSNQTRMWWETLDFVRVLHLIRQCHLGFPTGINGREKKKKKNLVCGVECRYRKCLCDHVFLTLVFLLFLSLKFLWICLLCKPGIYSQHMDGPDLNLCK